MIQAANLIWTVYLLILVETLFVRRSLHFTTLVDFTSSHLNFTQLHFTTLSFGLYEELCPFMIVHRSVLLRMRNVSDRIIEKIRTHILPSVSIFRQSCRLRNNVGKYVTEPDIIVGPMRIACWNTKATDTHSEYVILIVFPLQLRLCECAWILRYTYVYCMLNAALGGTLLCFKGLRRR